jgi:hypothetical protein
LDRVDLFVASGDGVSIGNPFAVGSIVGPVVVRGVVGDWLLASSSGIDGVDLVVTVGSVLARIGYLLTGRRVGRLIVARRVVGELFLAPTAGIDCIDLFVVSVVFSEGWA